METGPNWTEVAIAVTSIVTAVAAVAGTAAAVFAGVFAFRQLTELRKQTKHSEESASEALAEAKASREAAHRPVLSFEKAILLGRPGDSRRFVEITLENVGPGAALDIDLRAVIAPLPQALAGQPPDAIQNYLDRAPQMQSGGELQLVSVAPQRRVRVILRRSATEWHFLNVPDLAVVALACRYSDVFGNEFQFPCEPGTRLFRPALFEDRLPEPSS